MQINKKLIIIFLFITLSFGTNILAAVKHSTQFPKEPVQPMPENIGIFPVPSKNAVINNPNEFQNTDNNITTPETDQPKQIKSQSSNSITTVKKNNIFSKINIPWVIFIICLSIVGSWLGFLKYKKML